MQMSNPSKLQPYKYAQDYNLSTIKKRCTSDIANLYTSSFKVAMAKNVRKGLQLQLAAR